MDVAVTSHCVNLHVAISTRDVGARTSPLPQYPDRGLIPALRSGVATQAGAEVCRGSGSSTEKRTLSAPSRRSAVREQPVHRLGGGSGDRITDQDAVLIARADQRTRGSRAPDRACTGAAPTTSLCRAWDQRRWAPPAGRIGSGGGARLQRSDRSRTRARWPGCGRCGRQPQLAPTRGACRALRPRAGHCRSSARSDCSDPWP